MHHQWLLQHGGIAMLLFYLPIIMFHAMFDASRDKGQADGE